MSKSSRAWWEGRRLIAATVVLQLIVIAWGVGVVGLDVEGARWLIHTTARIALVVFLLTFSASALNGLFAGPAGKRLLRNRRYLGLCFATSHVFHTIALFWYAETLGKSFPDLVSPPTLVAFLLGYVLLVAMTLTSTDGARRRLGRTRWTVLHRSGMYYLYALFVFSYLFRALKGDVLGIVLMIALLATLGMRAANRLRLRRASRPNHG